MLFSNSLALKQDQQLEMISFEPAMTRSRTGRWGFLMVRFQTRHLTQKTRRFQSILRHPSDPVQLLFERIPRVLDCSIDERHVLLESLEKCKNELSAVLDSYREKAISSLRRALSLNWKSEKGQVKEIARRWALCFPR